VVQTTGKCLQSGYCHTTEATGCSCWPSEAPAERNGIETDNTNTNARVPEVPTKTSVCEREGASSSEKRSEKDGETEGAKVQQTISAKERANR